MEDLSEGETDSESKKKAGRTSKCAVLGLAHESPRALNWRECVRERLGAGRG